MPPHQKLKPNLNIILDDDFRFRQRIRQLEARRADFQEILDRIRVIDSTFDELVIEKNRNMSILRTTDWRYHPGSEAEKSRLISRTETILQTLTILQEQRVESTNELEAIQSRIENIENDLNI
jgi:ABC-type phosphate transport system auxiliary subunit